jgi:DNA-nicking Smr family endonuclease
MADDTLSDEDKALFLSHMHRVKPLHEKHKRAHSPTNKSNAIDTFSKKPNFESWMPPTSCTKSAHDLRARRPKDQAQGSTRDAPRSTRDERLASIRDRYTAACPRDPNPKETYLSDFISETVFPDSNLSYCKHQVPNKRFHLLKQGKIPYEAKLDLHGLQSEEAREALSHFIQKQTENNKSCLLLIHGKGGHEGAPPIIKNLVNRWLPQFDDVLAFHSAEPKDGGYGAVYVLLKKYTS